MIRSPQKFCSEPRWRYKRLRVAVRGSFHFDIFFTWCCQTQCARRMCDTVSSVLSTQIRAASTAFVQRVRDSFPLLSFPQSALVCGKNSVKFHCRQAKCSKRWLPSRRPCCHPSCVVAVIVIVGQKRFRCSPHFTTAASPLPVPCTLSVSSVTPRCLSTPVRKSRSAACSFWRKLFSMEAHCLHSDLECFPANMRIFQWCKLICVS